ncbi:DinB family protein [Hymenobacter sp. 5516J-16]|uniref:DinB family protein n=1 Tax=Hymenobacter sublimis TaxID=2933777 RepID=A0ABY4J636_9BACT|nr:MULTISPECIES: DinB family protein [Hymenobacter]UOQ78310.1 DinB family protein [Hymenobacter sp. 5516J-16]UPL48291.1 DinB family protein [Hymenobacter sublimis]
MSATARRTTDFLDSLAAELQRVRDITNRRFRPLTDDQLNRGPGPGKWSVGQCLEHLNIVGGLYLPVMSRKIKAAKERGSKPAELVVHGFFGQKMTEAMRVPATEKTMKTPQQYAPSGSRLPRTVLEVFSRQLDELDSLIEQTRDINANAVRIPNPIIPLLLPRLTDALELLVEHMKRHILQAERVLDGQRINA